MFDLDEENSPLRMRIAYAVAILLIVIVGIYGY